MHIILRAFLYGTLISLATACAQEINDHPDTIYIHGNIITINEAQPFAQALATKEGLISGVGDSETLLRLKGPLTKIVDLAGATVVPGFIDAHSHFAGVGTQAMVANLLPAPDGPVNTIAELQAEIRHFIATSPIANDYKVAIGFNYDDSQLVEQRHPNRHDLDAVSTEIPIVVMHQSGHI